MRVLVRTPNWLGDTVMALPALFALRSHFPDEVLVAAGPRAFAPLLSAAAAVDETVLLSRDHSGRRGRGRQPGALAAPVLVPRSPRGVRPDPAGHGDRCGGDLHQHAQAVVGLQDDGVLAPVPRFPVLRRVGSPHVHDGHGNYDEHVLPDHHDDHLDSLGDHSDVPGEQPVGRLDPILRRHALRAATVGRVKPKLRRLSDTSIEALLAVIDTIRPGIISEEVDKVGRDIIKRAGFGKHHNHRLGYSIGLNQPPDWGEGQIMSIRRGEKRMLQTNMTFHLVPGCLIAGEIGIVNSATVRVTKTGCEILNSIPLKLFEN